MAICVALTACAPSYQFEFRDLTDDEAAIFVVYDPTSIDARLLFSFDLPQLRIDRKQEVFIAYYPRGHFVNVPPGPLPGAAVGRALDFVPREPAPPALPAFGRLHAAYTLLDLAKLLVGVWMAVALVRERR